MSSNQKNDVLGRPLEETKWEPNEANSLAKARIKVNIKAAMYIFIYLFPTEKKKSKKIGNESKRHNGHL